MVEAGSQSYRGACELIHLAMLTDFSVALSTTLASFSSCTMLSGKAAPLPNSTKAVHFQRKGSVEMASTINDKSPIGANESVTRLSALVSKKCNERKEGDG